ncbi:hypothetical protein JOQ06_026414 [Pogonophryne albipinna]|uniref:Uncharacterized protein n=1 Tax=Pogonophryne albipinna TaxID=1090488 RepID=A0AAD6FNJ7_9TELE|nr:hypothetical protein JOQ06_026414 [Pogonophryne albipinna]
MESVGASPQSIWSIKVESNGLADGEMREKGLPGGQLLRSSDVDVRSSGMTVALYEGGKPLSERSYEVRYGCDKYS